MNHSSLGLQTAILYHMGLDVKVTQCAGHVSANTKLHHVHVHLYIHMYCTCTYSTYMYTCMYMYMHMHIHMYMYIHMHMYMNTLQCVHAHVQCIHVLQWLCLHPK